MSTDDSFGDSYEEAVRRNFPEKFLPFEDGRECPPFTATLYRLAEALYGNQVLSEELLALQGHIQKCGACNRTVQGVRSLLSATPIEESLSTLVSDVSFEGTPLRFLIDAAKEVTSVSLRGDETLGEIFEIIYNNADLHQAEAFEAVGLSSDEVGDIDIFYLLAELGVPDDVLERFRNLL